MRGLFLSLLLIPASLASTSTFYHYPCGKLDGTLYVPDPAACKAGYTLSSGLTVPNDLACGFDEGAFYCGAKGTVCTETIDCAHGLVCKKTHNGKSKKCTYPKPQPSPKAKRTLSTEERKEHLCPKDQTACSLGAGHLGFECIDVQTNLEQCGGCASGGGMDCTQLPGVESVACVNGSCRIGSCSPGHQFNFRKRSCVPTLIIN
ncbi:hypothetical protein JCM8097_006095 [Rhodosporidiobolus ruineniae]